MLALTVKNGNDRLRRGNRRRRAKVLAYLIRLSDDLIIISLTQ